MKQLLGVPVILVLLLFGAVGPGASVDVAAQATQATPAFVYGINAAIPDNFVGTFAPGNDAIYLLAGETSVISPRMTEIYFWPITNEYRANWSTHNELVPGTLEVLSGGTIVAELPPVQYTIQFTRNEDETTAELFLGQDAVDAEARFRARQKEFQDATTAYNTAENAWLAAAEDANQKIKAGEEVSIPPPPEPPAPIGLFSNGLNTGMAIDLDPGAYAIRLRGDDGKTVPGSERQLTVFQARRAGIGYTVVPETRWTTPLESPAPGDVVFGATGTNIFLEPHLSREYPAREWSLLQNPQQPAESAGGWQWVNGERLRDGTLEIVSGDRVQAEQNLTPYRVKQTPGKQLGYDVSPFDPTAADAPDAPDFEAFPVTLANAGELFDIRLRSSQGEIMAGSTRQIRAAESVPVNRLFLLPVVPLLIGAVAVGRFGRRAAIPRELAG
ncbi:MAG: hypothetical protein U0031_18200 [Thermomicrobiales bacterium]